MEYRDLWAQGTFSWKAGAPTGYKHMPAAEAVGVLAGVDQRRQRLTSETLADDVEEAGPAHPLGWAFTFDPQTGMRKLHILEAGHLIRHIAVTQIVPEQAAPIRALVYVRDESGERFEPTHLALRNVHKRQQVLCDVRKDWDEFRTKMDELLAVCALL